MATYQTLLREIEDGPSGPSVGAFFDMDRTVLAGFSAQDLFVERLKEGEMSIPELIDGVAVSTEFARGKIDFTEWVNATISSLRGQLDETNRAFGRKVFDERVAARIYPEARGLVEAHFRKGHTVAIVSSATSYQVDPVAEDFGIDNVLCTHLEVENGVCTGRIIEPACYGEGKRVAAQALCEEKGADLKNSYFYSDGAEDLPLLEAVKFPKPLNPGRKLTRIAEERDWPITRFDSRGTPSTMDIVRTGLAYGSSLVAASAALSAYALNRSPWQARNIFNSIWGELSAASTGLKINVEGEEYLWSNRPAVFMFNHQSAVDVIVMIKLLKRDFAPIGKIEISRQPLIGQIGRALGTFYVDRSNTKKAIEAIKPAVDGLRSGISIMMAPEGTRSVTNKLGPFKKGGFHLSMQANVPIVPIVLFNTTDAMPKGSAFARPSTIRVKVLPPIFTNDWEVEKLDTHIDEVRRLFLHELGQEEDESPRAPVKKTKKAASKAKPKTSAKSQPKSKSKTKRKTAAKKKPATKKAAKSRPASSTSNGSRPPV